MTGQRDVDRILGARFEADAQSPVPAGGLERALDATRRRTPRPAWLASLGSHWVGDAPIANSSVRMRSLPRLGLRWSTAVILLLVIAALVGATILVGARLLKRSPLPLGHLGHLAYALNGDVYVADWDGRNPILVADGLPAGGPTDCGSFWGEGPMWSPDGRHFAYRSDWGDPCRAPSSGNVHLSDPQGRVVASFPGTGWGIAWSPDSTRVTTWLEVYQTIGVYGIDGVRQALLPLPPGERAHGDYDPYWSPDGTSVLIRLGALWELPLDGRSPRPIPADDPRSNWRVDSSPDGALSARADDAGSLILMAADGSQARVLVPEGVNSILDVMWSPTGDRIAFEAGPRDSAPDELRIVEVASGRVTSLANVRGSGMTHLLRWSPDGDRILFWNADTANVESLWTIRADGSDAQLLVADSGWGDWQLLPAGS
jgi:Tol biopolymer transport system component